MLVGAEDRGVHTDRPVHDPGGVGVGQQSRENVVPGAIAGVAAVPLPQRLPRPELGRDIPPGQAAPVSVDDALEYSTVVSKRAPATTLRRGQERGQPGPLNVGQDRSARHRYSIAHPDPPISETRPRPVRIRLVEQLAVGLECSQAQPGHGIAHERGVVAVVGLDHGVAGVAGLAAHRTVVGAVAAGGGDEPGAQ